MEKKPEIDGRWVDIEAEQMVSMIEEVEKSELLAIRSVRIELGADDKKRFVERFVALMEQSKEETEGMDDSQKSFYVFRKMLVG